MAVFQRNLRKDYSGDVASFVELFFVLSHASSGLQLLEACFCGIELEVRLVKDGLQRQLVWFFTFDVFSDFFFRTMSKACLCWRYLCSGQCVCFIGCGSTIESLRCFDLLLITSVCKHEGYDWSWCLLCVPKHFVI